MKVSCYCIANDNGVCVAKACHGEIRMISSKLDTAEARREHYKVAVQDFLLIFSEGYEDDDLEE